jgi:hypothetical protein
VTIDEFFLEKFSTERASNILTLHGQPLSMIDGLRRYVNTNLKERRRKLMSGTELVYVGLPMSDGFQASLLRNDTRVFKKQVLIHYMGLIKLCRQTEESKLWPDFQVLLRNFPMTGEGSAKLNSLIK